MAEAEVKADKVSESVLVPRASGANVSERVKIQVGPNRLADELVEMGLMPAPDGETPAEEEERQQQIRAHYDFRGAQVESAFARSLPDGIYDAILRAMLTRRMPQILAYLLP